MEISVRSLIFFILFIMCGTCFVFYQNLEMRNGNRVLFFLLPTFVSAFFKLSWPLLDVRERFWTKSPSHLLLPVLTSGATSFYLNTFEFFLTSQSTNMAYLPTIFLLPIKSQFYTNLEVILLSLLMREWKLSIKYNWYKLQTYTWLIYQQEKNSIGVMRPNKLLLVNIFSLVFESTKAK